MRYQQIKVLEDMTHEEAEWLSGQLSEMARSICVFVTPFDFDLQTKIVAEAVARMMAHYMSPEHHEEYLTGYFTDQVRSLLVHAVKAEENAMQQRQPN